MSRDNFVSERVVGDGTYGEAVGSIRAEHVRKSRAACACRCRHWPTHRERRFSGCHCQYCDSKNRCSRVMYIPKQLESITVEGKGRALIANKNFKNREIILPLKGIMRKCSESTPDAVQIDDDQFIDSDHRYVEDHINHGCDPSAKIDFETMYFVALRDLKKGEEITYNYLTTEYDLARDNVDFDCRCGSPSCFGRIKGFMFLTKSQKLKLKPLLSPFLKKKLASLG